MEYDWLIDRAIIVKENLKENCAFDLDKYDNIALVFYNSCYSLEFEEFIYDEQKCIKFYSIIYKLCSIPGIGSMPYPSGWVDDYNKRKIHADSYWLADNSNYYYQLEKTLNYSHKFLYSLGDFIKESGLYGERYILRYGTISNDFREPKFFKNRYGKRFKVKKDEIYKR